MLRSKALILRSEAPVSRSEALVSRSEAPVSRSEAPVSRSKALVSRSMGSSFAFGGSNFAFGGSVFQKGNVRVAPYSSTTPVSKILSVIILRPDASKSRNTTTTSGTTIDFFCEWFLTQWF